MVRKLMALVLLVPSFLLGGCGLISINSNIPFITGSGTIIEVVNASEYDLTLSVNGVSQEFEFPATEKSATRRSDRLRSGESVAIRIRNWSGQGGEVIIVAKAWAGNEFIGTTVAKTHVAYNYQQADAIMITNEAFRERASYYQGSFFGFLR